MLVYGYPKLGFYRRLFRMYSSQKLIIRKEGMAELESDEGLVYFCLHFVVYFNAAISASIKFISDG